MSYRDDDRDLLNDPDKRVGEARGILSVLWRQLLVLRNIDGWRWDKLMKGYLADPRNGIPNNSRDRSSVRGNLNKEFRRPDMTWRVFIKAVLFTNPIRARFSLEVTYADGKTWTVSAKLKDRGPALEDHSAGDASEEDGEPEEYEDLQSSEYRHGLEHSGRRR